MRGKYYEKTDCICSGPGDGFVSDSTETDAVAVTEHAHDLGPSFAGLRYLADQAVAVDDNTVFGDPRLGADIDREHDIRLGQIQLDHPAGDCIRPCPVRLEVKKIGDANVTAARSRAKFIGGERAHYNENLM